MNDRNELLAMATKIVSAYVRGNAISPDQVPALIADVRGALHGAGTLPTETEPLKPAVSIRRSVAADHIVCLEDGRRLKSIRRHLTAAHGLTPQQYREKWGLPGDYPLVAPAYAQTRSELAKSMGLGWMGRGSKRR
jgi:predicted transcriptional regulator